MRVRTAAVRSTRTNGPLKYVVIGLLTALNVNASLQCYRANGAVE